MGLTPGDPIFDREQDCAYFDAGFTPKYAMAFFANIGYGPDWQGYMGKPPDGVIKLQHLSDCLWAGSRNGWYCEFRIATQYLCTLLCTFQDGLSPAFGASGPPGFRALPNTQIWYAVGGFGGLVMVPTNGFNSLREYARERGFTDYENIRFNCIPLSDNRLMVQMVHKLDHTSITFIDSG